MTHTSNADHTHYYPKMRAAHLDRQCVVSYISMSQTKRNNADLWQLAKIHSHPTVDRCAIFHMTAKQITLVSTRMKPIDMSCSKNETIANHMTAEIKTDHTRFHKSKFCPVRNRPKLWNFTMTMSMSTKISKTSQNYKSTPVSAWQLSAQHFVFYTATADRPCQSLVLQPSSQMNQNL